MKLDANNINPKGLLELKEVGISINGNQLFEKLNIEIPEGSIVTVMGPSGCGKSSLLSLICGTISTDFSTYGQIQLGGKTLLDQPPENEISEFCSKMIYYFPICPLVKIYLLVSHQP